MVALPTLSSPHMLQPRVSASRAPRLNRSSRSTDSEGSSIEAISARRRRAGRILPHAPSLFRFRSKNDTASSPCTREAPASISKRISFPASRFTPSPSRPRIRRKRSRAVSFCSQSGRRGAGSSSHSSRSSISPKSSNSGSSNSRWISGDSVRSVIPRASRASTVAQTCLHQIPSSWRGQSQRAKRSPSSLNWDASSNTTYCREPATVARAPSSFALTTCTRPSPKYSRPRERSPGPNCRSKRLASVIFETGPGYH